MIIRTLDENLMSKGFIDDYQSFLWTEKYDEAGDVEIYVPASSSNLEFYRNSTFITIMNSKRLMLIEKLNIKRSISSGRWIVIQGTSAEILLKTRILLKNYSVDETVPNNKRIQELFCRIFNENIAEPTLLLNDDTIPQAWRNNSSELNKRKFTRTNYSGGSRLDLIRLGDTSALEDTELEADEDVQMDLSKGENLYEIYTDYIKTKHIGMRLIWDERNDYEALYLDFYKGINHTSVDDDSPEDIISNIIFSNEWDNITDMSFDEDLENFRTLAYTDKSLTDAIVYSRYSEIPASLNRKEVYIDLSNENISASSTEKLLKKLKEKTEKIMVKEHNKKTNCDGEVDPNGFYQYHVHYDLGDVVEFRDDFGYTGQVRISEYMYSSDSSGEKSYPGFSVDDD